MPKRLIDGEALWGSSKLTHVEPARYRAEYANILPLAMANGVFECEPQKVWAQVYAYNRPDISLSDVVQILDEFEKAKMIFRWIKEGKQWGYFVGIENGRLPSGSAYQNGKKGEVVPNKELNSFLGISEQYADSVRILPEQSAENDREGLVRVGLGLGLGFGLGKDQGASDDAIIAYKSFTDEVEKRILVAFGFIDRPGPYYTATKKSLKELERVYGHEKLSPLLLSWLNSSMINSAGGSPVAAFVRAAPTLIIKAATQVQPEEHPDLQKFLERCSILTGAQVRFNNSQQIELCKLLNKHGLDLIVDAIKLHWSQIDDDFQRKFAAKNFVETAEQYVAFVKQERARKEHEAQIVATAGHWSDDLVPEEDEDEGGYNPDNPEEE